MRILCMALLIFPALCSRANFDDYFVNQTLRIDYIHSGDQSAEEYSLDKLIREPIWDRSFVNLIDTFDYGKYRFEAFDSLTGTLLYRLNYANLFSEWISTDEAKNVRRAFYETVIMPYPKKAVRLVFSSRDKKNQWNRKWSFYVDPSSYLINPEARMPRTANCIYRSGEPSKTLDIVFLADGYAKKEMKKFRKDAARFMKYFLECEPYLSRPQSLNFWTVESPSEESSTDFPSIGVYKRTIINSGFSTFNIDRYLTSFDDRSIRDLAANVPYDQIFVIVNTEKYGGGGFYNTYALSSSDNRLAPYVAVHEFAHAIAGLGDEYYTSDVAVEDFYPAGVEPWEPNLTTLVNFGAKWKDMISPDTPVPTPATKQYNQTLGAFEGGGYTAKGVYRPKQDCTMKSTSYNNFCPVCLKALTDMLNWYGR